MLQGLGNNTAPLNVREKTCRSVTLDTGENMTMQRLVLANGRFICRGLCSNTLLAVATQPLFGPTRRFFSTANGDHDDFWTAVKTEAQMTPAHKAATATLARNKGTVEWARPGEDDAAMPPLPAGEAYGPYDSSTGTTSTEVSKPGVFNMSSSMHLSQSKQVQVYSFNDRVLIDIRNFFLTDAGDVTPTKKGIALTIPQWRRLKAATRDIDARIRELEAEQEDT